MHLCILHIQDVFWLAKSFWKNYMILLIIFILIWQSKTLDNCVSVQGKTASQEDGRLATQRTILEKSGFFYIKGRGKWEGFEVDWWLQTSECQQGSEEDCFVLSQLALVDVSLVTRLNNTFFLYTLGKGTFCRIPLMVSVFTGKTKQKLLTMGTKQAWTQSSERPSISLCRNNDHPK